MDLGASGPWNSITYCFCATFEMGSHGSTKSSSLMSRVVARCNTSTLDLVVACLRLQWVGSTNMEWLRPLTCCYAPLRDKDATHGNSWSKN
jgi:hypothetical protein